MAVTAVATTVGADDPARVQIAIDGLAVGATVEIVERVGVRARTVRGTPTIATSSQLVVLDDLVALNVPVVYEVRVGSAVATTAGVTVPWAHRGHLLQSIDGSVRVLVQWYDNADPRGFDVSLHLSRVAGRRRPVARFAPAGGVSGSWVIRTDTPETTAALELLLASGAPVVLRRTVDLADLAPTTVAAVSTVGNVLVSGLARRVWSLSWVDLDDPLAPIPATGDTWADVDAAYSGTDLADLDVGYAGTTFGDWNRTDWEGLGA